MRIPGFTPQPPWKHQDFPPSLPTAVAALRERVKTRIDGGGAVRDPCHSRILESALALRLLEETGLAPEQRRSLSAYLEEHRGTAQGFDLLLLQAALDRRASVSESTLNHFVSRAPGFTNARKRVTIAALLYALGVPPSAADIAAARNLDTKTGLHFAARTQTTAAKALLALAAGPHHAVGDNDLALLLASQQGPGVWERNLLIHLSVLHALRHFPHLAPVVSAGVDKLLPHQRDDGGIPFVQDLDLWTTATAGVALLEAGTPGPTLGRTAQYLLAHQQPDGGWSYTDDAAQTDIDDITVAVEFLHQLRDPACAPAIGRALGAVYRIRGDDGGFPTYVSGGPSEPCMTAAAINALPVQPGRHTATIDSALNYLASTQNPDGTYPPGWSASQYHTLFRVLLACRHVPTPTAGHVAQHVMGAVSRNQNPDGGWGQHPGAPSDAVSTAHALICLTQGGSAAQAAHGCAYLLDQQQADGSIASRPDSIGPRPFIFNIPALTDNYVLLGLAHCSRRLDRVRLPAPTGPRLLDE